MGPNCPRAGRLFKGMGVCGRLYRLTGKRPATRGGWRAGLAQRAGSGRIGLGPQRPAGKRRGERVITDLRREFGRRDGEFGRKIDGRAAAEAIAAAGKSFVVPMLVMRRALSGAVVPVLFRAKLAVSGIQMKRSMSVAARKCERQQHDQAAQKQGSLHGRSS